MGVQDLGFRMLVLMPFIGPRHCFAEGRFLKGWPSSAICYYLKHLVFKGLLYARNCARYVTAMKLVSPPDNTTRWVLLSVFADVAKEVQTPTWLGSG